MQMNNINGMDKRENWKLKKDVKVGNVKKFLIY